MFNRTQLSIAVSAALATALVGTAPSAMAQTPQQLDRVEVTGLEHQAHRRRNRVASADHHARGDCPHRRIERRAVDADDRGELEFGIADQFFCVFSHDTRHLRDFIAWTRLAKNAGAHQRQARLAVRLRLHQR